MYPKKERVLSLLDAALKEMNLLEVWMPSCQISQVQG